MGFVVSGGDPMVFACVRRWCCLREGARNDPMQNCIDRKKNGEHAEYDDCKYCEEDFMGFGFVARMAAARTHASLRGVVIAAGAAGNESHNGSIAHKSAAISGGRSS